MPQFICAFYPKKSAIANGAVAMTICLEAKSIKLADMKSTVALEESFADTSDNFFKPKISEYALGDSGRPPVGSFDTEWIKNYEWNEETKKFDLIPTVVTAEEINIETDPLEGARVISDLPVGERVTYILMYGATPEEIDHEHLSNAVDMFVDDEAPEEIRMMIDGMLKIPSINAMKPTSVAEIIDLIRAVMPPVESAEEVAKLAIGYAKNPAERGEQVERSKSGISRSYDLLDTEAALHVMGIRPSAAKASDLRNAKYLKDDRDPTWRAWSTEYRIITGILNIPGDELFDLMADGHKDLKLTADADARRAYVRSKLAGHPLLPDYHADDQPEIKNLGKGQFTVEALTGSDKNASNEGEKTEVAGEQLTVLQTHIRDLLTGKTNVVSADEMAELLTEKGLGARFLVKQLAHDFEISGNAFSYLNVDEIHSLTLDVVESWISDQADRITFITERAKFYFVDRTIQSKAENPQTETKPAEPASNEPKSETNKAETASEPAITATKPAEPTSSEPVPDDFKTRAEILEKELAAKTGDAATNLSIWKRVQRTDPARTKQQNTTNSKGEITRTVTSIRPTYQYMRATELFGPFGLGWGVDVVEERFDRGIPMMEPVLDNTGREIAKKVMRDGDGTIMATQNHTMRIVLWYILDGKRGEITAYGHTKAVYASKYGFTVEEEPSKKSLTDATTKALSSLGFSADVYLGLFDDADYTADNAYEHNLKNASDKAEDEVRLRKELDERFAKNTETMRAAVSAGEVSKIASSLTRTIGSEIKTAKRANDTDHVKYLESRLNRLEEIKADCLKKFEGEKV